MENNKQLIYVDEFRKLFWSKLHDLKFVGPMDVEHIILNTPTVDAVEVVHGKWIPMYKVDWIYDKEWLTDYICTECGQLHRKKSNYCPNCGAKMEE